MRNEIRKLLNVYQTKKYNMVFKCEGCFKVLVGVGVGVRVQVLVKVAIRAYVTVGFRAVAVVGVRVR